MVTAGNFCGALHIDHWSRNVDVGIIAYVITHKASRGNCLMTPTLVVWPQNVEIYVFHVLDGISWIDGESAFKSFVGNHVNTEETYKRGKESSSYVNNVQSTSPTFIKSNLDKLQLQNEEEARKGNNGKKRQWHKQTWGTEHALPISTVHTSEFDYHMCVS